jgi:hypothetical protein
VLPERWGARHGSIARCCKVCLETVIGNASSLFEAQHAFSDFYVYMAIGGKRKKVVLVDDFLRNKLEWELHVFIAVHGCAIVEVFDIQRHNFCIGSRYGAAEETFSGGQAGALYRGHTREVKFVAADSDLDTVGLVLGQSNG